MRSNESHVSIESTQSSHKSWPVDNLLSKFQNLPAPPPAPPVPQLSLRNHVDTSPFQPISSRASSPRTSTPIQHPTPHNSPSHTPTHKSDRSGHGGSFSRNSCGSQSSSVYQARIESLQEQVQTLLNQSAEKEDKLQRMESELEETKRQMKELINIYKQEQVKKTIQSEIPKSKRHAEKTHFEEEKSQGSIHKPEPMRPQPTFQPPSHPPTPFEAPQKPQFPQPPPVPLEPKVHIQSPNPPIKFPVTPIHQTTFESHCPTPVPTEFRPPPAPVGEKLEQVHHSMFPPPQNTPPTEDKIFFQTLTQALSSISQKVNDQTFRASAPRRSNSLQVRLPDLPHFDASLPEIIVYFFEQFELIKEIQQWEDKECIDHLRLKHTGTAKTILEEEIQKVPSVTYNNIKKRLMDRYLSPAVMQSVMDQLLQAKQTAEETLNQYYNRFKYLDKVVASRTADWYIGRFEVNCFVKGFLNKTLSDNVCRRYPKDVR